MYNKAHLITMSAVTSVHVGSGSDMGDVNLPIQREKHTTFPNIGSPSLKGGMRAHVKGKSSKKSFAGLPMQKCISLVFGPENGSEHAGAMVITDAKILFFPVKSALGVFAWVTCPLVLERFRRDLEFTGKEYVAENFPVIPAAGSVSSKSALCPKQSLAGEQTEIMLEDTIYKTQKLGLVDVLAGFLLDYLPDNDILKTKLLSNIAIVSDDEFKDIAYLSTEVLTRIKIDPEKGTTTGGALFQEEMLPAETVMYSLLMSSPLFLPEEERNTIEQVMAQSHIQPDEFVYRFLTENIEHYIQLGGDTSLGKGIMSIKFNKGGC